MRIIRQEDAIRYVLQTPGTFACYAGAGISSEAGVKTASEICDEIIKIIVDPGLSPRKKKARLTELDWDNKSYRYAKCIEHYGSQASRVEYFRKLVEGKRPAFCHHAVAMLVAEGIFKGTVFTTNFDKLLEVAFARQGEVDCQSIRSGREIEYWTPDQDRVHVVKLHGDYDAYNMANTVHQIVQLDRSIQSRSIDLLRSSGLLVLGAAGHEKSIHTFMDELVRLAEPPDRVLSFGLLWGVYMGAARPSGVHERDVAKQITASVGQEIRNLMDRMKPVNEQFAFFPVWGTGDFLLRLIDATANKLLMSRARRYLDHDMRLRDVFRVAGLTPKAIEDHLANLRAQRRRIDGVSRRDGSVRTQVLEAHGRRTRNKGMTISVRYGDITSRALLDDHQGMRRGVVSPEDICISAGGGVAYQLLKKAGDQELLRDLAKLQPISQGTAAVTSAGNLPVEYLFHSAALRIDPDGRYRVNAASVRATILSALEQAAALGVSVLWVPLIGSGAAGFSAKASLSAILEAIGSFRARGPMFLNIVIFSDDVLPRTDAVRICSRALKQDFTLASTEVSKRV